MEEPSWKKIKLSLERPYKDDNGEVIPTLLDIAPDGTHIYEPKEDPSTLLGTNIRRIFLERGIDFFDRHDGKFVEEQESQTIAEEEESDRETDASKHIMTPAELLKMQMEILPQLFIASGEMSHARDLLSFLLASSLPAQPSPAPTLPSSTLTASTVIPPAPIASVEAFNAQLAVGGKDEALRKAANIFKSAASSLERGRQRGEKYWMDALKIRMENWGLVPAPLPFGAPTGKGADKTSKDFLISFGLEESPPHIRRRAIGHMATYDTESEALVFPFRQKTRLKICLRVETPTGVIISSHNSIMSPDFTMLGSSLKAVQREMVEEEIFSALIKEASSLPTASARVSERLIVIDAAQGTELIFELVDSDTFESSPPSSDDEVLAASCDLIYAILQALLLGMHKRQKHHRLEAPQTSSSRMQPQSALLQPVIDLIQYQVFCERVKAEFDHMVQALRKAGIPTRLRFTAIGESGEQLVNLLVNPESRNKLGGEVVLRIDNRYTLRLTFLAPSSLTAHLPQATLPIASIPQLAQLLSDEVEQYLLNKACEVGSKICDRVNGIWFSDVVSSRAVGRWSGCVLNFRVVFAKHYVIHSSAFRLHKMDRQMTLLDSYSPESTISFPSWVDRTITHVLLQNTKS